MGGYFAAFLVGLIVGYLATVHGAASLISDRIEAGYFEHDAKAYRVERVDP